jgi:Lrp/AsnC family transcriptional regulator for asnA, asnC and gidA
MVLLMTKLDQIDKQILDNLVRDCRTPYREIAKSLGLSATAIKSRVDELVAAGVITDFIVDFTPAMIGSEAVMLWLKTDGTEDSNKFISEIATIRGVMQIVPIYGGDYVVFAEYTSSSWRHSLKPSRAIPMLIPLKYTLYLSNEGRRQA